MKNIFIPYGRTRIPCSVPVNALLCSRVGELVSEKSGIDLVREAMDRPIGAPRLSELARGKKSCTIIISDHTRPVPSRDILPPMLRQLREENPNIRIKLLVATGFHRPTTTDELLKKLGEEIAGREEIIVHNAFDPASNVNIGTLPSGAPLVIDRAAVETELLIAEGFIEPHFFAGFSGGRKSVLPGICDKATVLGNHCGAFIASPFARAGVLDANPLHRDMLAAAEMAKLAFIVNAVIDEQKKTVAAFAGDFRQAHEAGVAFLRQYCEVKAVPGAVLIMCAELADGTGGDSFYRSLRDCESPRAHFERCAATPQAETIPDQWESQILARILMKHRVIFVSRPEMEQTIREMKMDFAPSLEQAVAMARKEKGGNPRITVIPDGVSVIVRQ